MNKSIISIIHRAAESTILTKDEIVTILQGDHPTTQELFLTADKIRRQAVGNEVHLRGIVEFSNYCKRQCMYCGLRKGNHSVARYRMTANEIYSVALTALRLGYRTIVLQSGEDDHFDADLIAKIVLDIKNLGLAVTLSCGERSYEEYRLWKKAGADRYLIKHETAVSHIYNKLHPGDRLSNRVKCLNDLRSLGYQVGSGCMVGLPQQGLEDLAEDLLFMQKLDVEMAGIGPFIPHPQTPLGDCSRGQVETTLKMTALARLMMPWVHLPATTALESIDSLGRQKALNAGANVVMPNLTPSYYRSRYEIYPDKICLNDDPKQYRELITGIITSLGRKVAVSQGHSLKEQFIN